MTDFAAVTAMDVDNNNNDEMRGMVEAMTASIAKQDTPGLKEQLKKIQQDAKSQELVDFVVPLLFEQQQNQSGDALSLVGCLVSVDASTYLKPVSRKVKSEALIRSSSEKPLTVSPQFLAVMVQQLNGTDVEVSSNATEALVACCRKLGPTLSDPAMDLVLNAWKQAWDNMVASVNRTTSSTICVRCATALMDLAALNDNLMERAVQIGATELLLKMMTHEQDPLLQMTCLDILERMANGNNATQQQQEQQPVHANRAQWLCSQPVLDPLLEMSGARESDPDPILGGPALRVLSVICRLGQTQQTQQHPLGGSREALLGFHKALHNFQGSGELDRLALIDAISSFASASPDALELVLSDPMTRDGWLNLSVAQPKLKAVILTSVAMVIDPATATAATQQTNTLGSNLAMKLFAAIGQTNNNNGNDSTQVVLALAKSPLPETRLGAYNLMRAIANTETGSQVLLAHPGFFEFLTSRQDGETTKEGREGKYAVVEAVMNSPVKGLLAEDIVTKLERILKDGPHYVPLIRPDLVAE